MIHQTIKSSHIDLEHGNQSNRDTCCQAFVDDSTIVQNGRTEILNETCPFPIMELSLSIKALMYLKTNAR